MSANCAEVNIVGAHGLLGELITAELRRRAEVRLHANLDNFMANRATPAGVVVIWSTAMELSELRTQLRRTLPVEADPLLLCVDEQDPHVYLMRLGETHVDRRRVGFSDVFEIIAHWQATMTVSVPQAVSPQSQYA